MRMFPPEPRFVDGVLHLTYHDPADEAKFLIDIYPYLDLKKYVGRKINYGDICAEIHYDICNLMYAAGYRW